MESMRKMEILPPAIHDCEEHIPINKAMNESQIFSCDFCGRLRVYGRAGIVPENTNPLLVCHNQHAMQVNQHFPHTFEGIIRGGELRR